MSLKSIHSNAIDFFVKEEQNLVMLNFPPLVFLITSSRCLSITHVNSLWLNHAEVGVCGPCN